MRETVTELTVKEPKGSKTLSAVVDTGANSVISRELAKELGIIPWRADEVLLADGSIDKVGVGSAEVEIEGIRQVVPVYISEGVLVGLTTLEAAGLRANHVTQTLEKVHGNCFRLT